MSPQEHYFENLLFAFAKYGDDGWKRVMENDSNKDEMTKEECNAIQTCASYIIYDCCYHKQEYLKEILQ